MELYPHFFWKVDNSDYNCSLKHYHQWRITGITRPLVGTYYIIYGSTLYIIVILAMSNRSILKKCCYKLMYYNCFYDFINVFLNSIVSGYLMIDGAVFCTHPLIILLTGGFGLAFWCGTCVNCIAIGVNRFCTIFNVGQQTLFRGNRPYYWMVLSFLYTFFVISFTRPVIFHSQFGAWLLTPLIIDFNSEVNYYKNNAMLFTNIITPTILTIIYVSIICKLYCHRGPIFGQQLSKSQYKICLQSGIICGLTALCAFFYSYMQLFPVPEEVVTGTQILYQYCTGLQCFVYLCMNQAIKKRATKLIFHLPLPSTNLINPSSTRENQQAH